MAIATVKRQAIHFIPATEDDFNETLTDLQGQKFYTPVQIDDPTQFEIKFTGAQRIEFRITDLNDSLLYAEYNEESVTKITNYAKIEIDWTGLDTYRGCVRIWVRQSHQTWEQGYKSEALVVGTTFENTLLLSWKNNESVFGFLYPTIEYTQYLRVKGRLWHPQFPKDKKDVFVDSAGKRRILYSRTKEEMILDISEVPDYTHRALSIALEHDTFLVDDVAYVCEENDYSPSWRKSSRLAPVEITLTEDELNLTNAYCQAAGSCDFEVEILYTVGATDESTPDGIAAVQTYYGQTFTYSSDGETYQESNILTGLPDGENTIYVKDIFECVKSTTITIEIMDQIGTVKMFAGTIAGNFDGSGYGLSGWGGWALCNGSNGTVDLSGKFVVGYDESDSDYDTLGNTGGEKTHSLTNAEMPRHNHNISYNAGAGANDFPSLVANTAAGTSTSLVKYKGGSGSAEAASDGVAHENRPPYYTLAYVQRIA